MQYNWDPKTGNVIVPCRIEGESSLPKTITVVAGQVVPNPSKVNFAPAPGRGLSAQRQTVIRGGYGIFNEFQGRYAYAQERPFQIAETFFNSIQNGHLLPFQTPSPAQAQAQSVAKRHWLPGRHDQRQDPAVQFDGRETGEGHRVPAVLYWIEG